jgi:5'(3')-deoxyribonucleotidase
MILISRKHRLVCTRKNIVLEGVDDPSSNLDACVGANVVLQHAFRLCEQRSTRDVFALERQRCLETRQAFENWGT